VPRNGRDIVDRYARRFECEEGFRDLKDWRFGMALNYTRIGSDLRRERLLFVFALAAFLLTLVGVASERLGFDRHLRANTSQRRTHSLFRQGREIVKGALPDLFEHRCFQLLRLMLAAALDKGFCHVLAWWSRPQPAVRDAQASGPSSNRTCGSPAYGFPRRSPHGLESAGRR
jgi:hypothetical protein